MCVYAKKSIVLQTQSGQNLCNNSSQITGRQKSSTINKKSGAYESLGLAVSFRKKGWKYFDLVTWLQRSWKIPHALIYCFEHGERGVSFVWFVGDSKISRQIEGFQYTFFFFFLIFDDKMYFWYFILIEIWLRPLYLNSVFFSFSNTGIIFYG